MCELNCPVSSRFCMANLAGDMHMSRLVPKSADSFSEMKQKKRYVGKSGLRGAKMIPSYIILSQKKATTAPAATYSAIRMICARNMNKCPRKDVSPALFSSFPLIIRV